MTYFTKKTNTTVGELTLIASERGLAAILWEGDDPKRVRLEPQLEDSDNDILVEAERQLKSYFDGTLKVFSVPLDFVGTEFQTSVWKALLKIPFGQTRTYTQIAKQIGRPTAARAVGAASGKNPISIMAPCHRVVGANGDLRASPAVSIPRSSCSRSSRTAGSGSAERIERGREIIWAPATGRGPECALGARSIPRRHRLHSAIAGLSVKR